MIQSGLSLIDFPYRGGFFNLKVMSAGNNSIVILLPGQTLPAEMFFGLPLYPDKSSITDKILKAGVDVAYLDPIGYGRSKGTIADLYTRDIMAEQMIETVKYLRPSYTNIFVQGFCSTCHVPLITATKVKVEGVVLQSPLIYKVNPLRMREYMEKRDPENILLHNTIDNLKNKRLKNKSDVLAGKSLKAANWEETFLDHLQTFENFPTRGEWHGINDMVWDLWLYDSANGHQGWKLSSINCPISVIKGELDYECSTDHYFKFIEILKSKMVVESIAPNATHFGMWDRDYDAWADSFILCLQKLLEAQ